MLTTMLYILFSHFGDYIKNSSLFNFVNVYPLYDLKIIVIITFFEINDCIVLVSCLDNL